MIILVIMKYYKTLDDFLKIKEKLFILLREFYEFGISWTLNYDGKITKLSYIMAKQFIKKLPFPKGLPIISPDGEGGVLMLWNYSDIPLLIIVDEFKLHMIKAVTTDYADYFDDINFDGIQIPDFILDAIP